MTLDDNKAIAIRFLHSFGEGNLQLDLLHQQATFWSHRAGEMQRDTFIGMTAGLAKVSDTGVAMTVRWATAEGDRVVIEAAGDCTLRDGRKYDNIYCFVFTLRDGQVFAIREYNDTRLSTAVFGQP